MAVRESSATDPVEVISARLPTTDRRGWALLAAVALLILAGLLWAALSRSPVTVTGAGMIVPVGGFVDIGTSVSGSVTEVRVSPGDEVANGQVVATIRSDDGSIDEIISRVAGSVATIVARQGGVTQPGAPLLTIDPYSTDVAIGFLPAAQGGQVRVGMPALVAVSSFPESQYGFITGTVRSVAQLPVTFDRIQLLVGGNEQLPGFFTASGPAVEVSVTLDTDPTNASGYAWTTGNGPDRAVSTGELASVSVVVSDSSPLERIFG